jgi:hypothetical protein
VLRRTPAIGHGIAGARAIHIFMGGVVAGWIVGTKRTGARPLAFSAFAFSVPCARLGAGGRKAGSGNGDDQRETASDAGRRGAQQ